MIVSNDGQKLTGMRAPAEILEEINRNQTVQDTFTHEYYIHNDDKESCIITNVPRPLYGKIELTKYEASANPGRETASVIAILKKSIRHLHRNPPVPDASEDGKTFQLNQCYPNSKEIFYISRQLRNQISLRNEPKIVLGYVVNKKTLGLRINDKVIKNDSITLINWHTWNYVENLLIDMTLFNTAAENAKPVHSRTSWGKADDHVFITPPEGLEYWGVGYLDFKSFNNEFIEHIVETPESGI